jgi:hypothetical protein
MLPVAVQFGNAHLKAVRGDVLEPLLALIVLTLLAGLALGVLGLSVPWARSGMRSWRARRRRTREAANAERRARAMMSELCPHGWQAQITVYDGRERPGEPNHVALDWTEYEDATGRPAVSRRVWAPTIAEALEAMVADRRTDETLEQIERGALAGGQLWPDG